MGLTPGQRIGKTRKVPGKFRNSTVAQMCFCVF